MAGFEFFPDSGEVEIYKIFQLAASQTLYPGDAVKLSNGKITVVNGQTDIAIGVVAAPSGKPGSSMYPTTPSVPDITTQSPLPITSTATSEVFARVQLSNGGRTKFKLSFTPLVNDLDAESNASTTTVKVALADGSSSDLVGGYVYIPELGEAKLITANTYSSNVVTLTTAAFSRAVTTGDTVRIIPFGPGDTTVQFASANPQRNISNVIAELASGKLTVHAVDLAKKTVIVSLNPS